MDEAIFDLRNVSYSYLGKINALKDVSFKVLPGEQICIMGANGSGKSTLLAIMDALVFPTFGEFRAFGNNVTEEIFDSIKDNDFRRYFRKKVGFVFQNSDVQLFSSTVFEELAFGPLQLDLSKDEVRSRVEEVMGMMDIARLRERAPHTLSGGEKKKVCIASVLVNNPDVLLLDEPTAGLDPRTQLWLIEFLQELAEAGKTIITATHDLDIIEQISKRSLIHKHMHRHGAIAHQHMHAHEKEHSHEHTS
ncbi:MAG: ABC transporter ATP-binding protein [Methanothrix sp.]|nr:ABC transporter ATP-binding protein [Methanothrix sp.]